MIVGFTGTQRGMTAGQWHSVVQVIRWLNPLGVRHGDCIGADSQFHALCSGHIPVIVHPPLERTKRAFNVGNSTRPPKPYLERNKDIVNNCDILIATPHEHREVLRSGTWSTVRYARKVGRAHIIFLP